MSLFPTDDKARKNLPVFAMLSGYFPKAMREITKVCVANNVRYNPDKAPADISWARGKSKDQLGSLFRHIFERSVDGQVTEVTTPEVVKTTGIERIYVMAEAAWRACAQLELDIEAEEQKATTAAGLAAIENFMRTTRELIPGIGLTMTELAEAGLRDCDLVAGPVPSQEPESWNSIDQLNFDRGCGCKRCRRRRDEVACAAQGPVDSPPASGR